MMSIVLFLLLSMISTCIGFQMNAPQSRVLGARGCPISTRLFSQASDKKELLVERLLQAKVGLVFYRTATLQQSITH